MLPGSLYISKETRLAPSTELLVTNGRYRQKENHECWRDVTHARLVACTVSATLCIQTVILVHWRTLGKEVSLPAMLECNMFLFASY